MKTGCVVLNYKDADTTLEQVERIRGYGCLDAIVVVDNCSRDASVERLKAAEGGKVILLCAGDNRGYGAGNNLGIRYSREVLGMTHVVIANPDTEFSEQCVRRLMRIFERHGDVGVAAASMVDHSRGGQARAWMLLPFFRDLMAAGPVCRRLFRRALSYPESYFRGRKAVGVDVVHGSMLMVDAEKMLECGGYDERVFLYEEENILGWRMREHGYRTVLVLDQTYVHHNAVSISKTYRSAGERQRLRHESMMFYYRNYLKINRMQEAAARVFFSIILLEIWFCGRVLKMRW